MATIRDVAKLAGVGIGTVSRTISGKGSVSEDKRRRVEDAIRKLSFRPSSIAQSLSTKELGIVGLLLPSIGGAYYELILKIAEDELRAQGKYFVVATGSGMTQEEEGFNFLLARDCDGMLIFSGEISERRLIELESRFPSVAIMNRVVPTIEEKCFAADHIEGGRLAARTLLEAGHRDIAVITGPMHRLDARQRHDGFVEELAAAGVCLAEDLIVEGDYTTLGGQRCCDILLERHRSFSAIFCANAAMAVPTLSRLFQRGIHVPSDMAVIGYDELDFCAVLAPPLTTVDTAVVEIVRNACRYLLKTCYGIELEVQRQFRPRVIRRESV